MEIIFSLDTRKLRLREFKCYKVTQWIGIRTWIPSQERGQSTKPTFLQLCWVAFQFTGWHKVYRLDKPYINGERSEIGTPGHSNSWEEDLVTEKGKMKKKKITRWAVAHIRIRYMFFELICYYHFTDWELQFQLLDQNPLAETNPDLAPLGPDRGWRSPTRAAAE